MLNRGWKMTSTTGVGVREDRVLMANKRQNLHTFKPTQIYEFYYSNLYCSILWYDCFETALKTLRIAYNTSIPKLLGMPLVLVICLFVLNFLHLTSFSESVCILSETD